MDDGDRVPRFHVRFWGFDRTEVVSALAKLAGENEEARQEIYRVGLELERLQASMGDQLGGEHHVQRVLLAASKAADDIREQAEEEARRILREAEDQSRVIVQRLRDEAHEIEAQIESLIVRRREVETSVEALIGTMSRQLEQVRQKHDEHANQHLAKTG